MKHRKNQQSPTHAADWYQNMISELLACGVNPRQWIGNTGIQLRDLEVDETRISYAVTAELFERAADLTGNDLLGLKLGQKREMRRLGLVAFIGRSSPTVGSLLHNMSRYQRVFSDAIEIDVGELDGSGIVSWDFHVPQSVQQRQYVEFGGVGLIHWLRTLTGRDLLPEAVSFRHFRRSNRASVERFFGCSIEFGAADNKLTFKPSDLDITLRTADEHLYQMLLRYAEDALQNQSTVAPDTVVSVEREIAKNLRGTQAEVARNLGMSTRTLSRRLADDGTTFHAVSDDYCEALAKSLISETDMQIAEIAFALGYNSPSSFSTAFKRWTGKSPSAFRN